MLRKIKTEALRAQLAAVAELERDAEKTGDELGALQFSRKRASIATELATVQNLPERKGAVGLFFGGPAVFGSHGIKADFAGKVLEDFQNVVNKEFAHKELGSLGARGPVPLLSNANLMVTEVARGSFGFVLEEADEAEPLLDTALAGVLDDVTTLVSQLASENEAHFEEAVDALDRRVLVALRDFFRTLDDAGASMRIVEGERDVSLGHADIARARSRADRVEILDRDDVEMVGRLWLLPGRRQFQLDLLGENRSVYGKISPELARAMDPGGGQQLLDSPVGHIWRAGFGTREVRSRSGVRTHYVLSRLLERLADDS